MSYTGNPAVGPALLTAQYLDFNDIPDEEVPGYLRQLFELGVIGDGADTGDYLLPVKTLSSHRVAWFDSR